MKIFKLAILMFGVFLILTFFYSCNKSSEPTNSITSTNLSMKIISYQDAPATVDSNLCYTKEFKSWNTFNSLLDTLKADSLANWFAQSQYQITDMWFPEVGTVCSFPIQTENIVTIRLLQPDTSLKSQGYTSTSSVVSYCYRYYRHYIFTRK